MSYVRIGIALFTAASLALAGTGVARAGQGSKTHPATGPSVRNIVKTAEAAGSFKTLLAAVKAAGLTGTLSGKGPFTVLAPTDEAFAALPAGALEGLLKDKAQLKAVLLNHVVAGRAPSGEVVKLASVKTLGGAEWSVNASDGVKIGDATVIKADVNASNGVIHVIDRVLLKP
jgi:uncharacterized surface protein with fasciclin (FAS1) repeats